MPDAYDEACERAGASLRPPMDHGSRKVNYHVRVIDTELNRIGDRLQKLIRDLRVPDTDDMTWLEVVALRRYVREAQSQIAHVLDANDVWSRKGAVDAFGAPSQETAQDGDQQERTP